MRIVVLGGYGGMGSVSSLDLAETCKGCEIIIVGRNREKAAAFAKSIGKKNVKGIQVDVNNLEQTVGALKGADVVINATEYYMNIEVMKACLRAGTNYLDLGGLFHVTKKQLKLHRQFKKKNLIAVLGCGSTPGITNVMAEYGARFFDKIRKMHVSFADADFTKYSQPFVLPYTMYTLFDEFMMEPAVLASGKIKMVEPMSGEQVLEFPKPVGKVTGFYTLHSELATFPSSFKSKGIKECSFRVTFPEDFRSKIRFLIDAGFASEEETEVSGARIRPKDFTAKIMNQWLPKKGTKINDLEYVRVDIVGTSKGKKLRATVDCLTKSNKKWNIPSGTYDTGVPPSIIAQMIAEGQVKERGVLPPELCIKPEMFFKELERRGMKIRTKFYR